ncbi:MAG: hypothetical protein OQK48_01880 [Sulfurimonas sp.]|uniref:hypothetical protein n=1 Tax=Sulfurimonas sp. TaxID=2022749 RepID=UPI00262C08B7|nr:hypothetical protein [Sulfurimonas sp.]MCW8895237.1 hypothetical protein [Sulfurimonas sp.]MCW8953671.1 hypothetical protein [Sulfurimonas sp.]MCW9067588.1 hypothetical protein [Sulfurimonas sp.]
MKNNLGKIFLIFLIFVHVEIFASTYEWSAKADKTTAYVNEAIHLTYICEFSDRSELYSIDFNPQKEHEDYTLHILSESERIVDNKRVNSYEFVVFTKKAKEINFEFETTMKKTTKESIENTVIGRDNKEYADFTRKTIKQKSIKVDVKPSPKELVGDFVIEVKKDKQKVKAYEPYHLHVSIKGNGNFEAIKPMDFNIEGVKVFAGKVIQDIELSKAGYSGTWSQKFAFVASKDFKVPEINMEYFNLKTKSIQTLHVDAVKVEVTKGYVKEELLDEVDNDFKVNYDYFYYLLTFIAGYLLAKIKITNYKSNAPDVFLDKIDKAKSMDELLMILALDGSIKYKDIVLQIETKKLTSLKTAKNMVKLTSC